MSDAPNFLSRWSRLKRRVTLEREKAPPAEPAATPEGRVQTGAGTAAASPSPQDAGPAAPPPGDDEPVDVSKLPDIDSLGPDSDYTAFMRKGVPDDLRRKALRRMWVTDATISGPDLLEMNALDYTGLEGPQPLTVTPPQAALAFLRKAKALVERAGGDGSEPAAPASDSRPEDTAQNDAKDRPPENSRG